MFLRKVVLKICSKFTGAHPCQSLISIKLLSNFIEIALRHGCSPVNLLHIFRAPFPRNTSGWLLLIFDDSPALFSANQLFYYKVITFQMAKLLDMFQETFSLCTKFIMLSLDMYSMLFLSKY